MFDFYSKKQFLEWGWLGDGIFDIKSKSHRTKKPSHKKGEETNGKL
jgi:hypothetical protein